MGRASHRFEARSDVEALLDAFAEDHRHHDHDAHAQPSRAPSRHMSVSSMIEHDTIIAAKETESVNGDDVDTITDADWRRELDVRLRNIEQALQALVKQV
jgi:hypothetical protein